VKPVEVVALAQVVVLLPLPPLLPPLLPSWSRPVGAVAGGWRMHVGSEGANAGALPQLPNRMVFHVGCAVVLNVRTQSSPPDRMVRPVPLYTAYRAV
jgi:hypothetical protein